MGHGGRCDGARRFYASLIPAVRHTSSGANKPLSAHTNLFKMSHCLMYRIDVPQIDDTRPDGTMVFQSVTTCRFISGRRFGRASRSAFSTCSRIISRGIAPERRPRVGLRGACGAPQATFGNRRSRVVSAGRGVCEAVEWSATKVIRSSFRRRPQFPLCADCVAKLFLDH